MLSSTFTRLPFRHRALAIYKQATSNRLHGIAANEESQASSGRLDAWSNVAYRHAERFGHCRLALTSRHTQHTSWQPFSSSQHAAQKGKEDEHSKHGGQSGDASAAGEPSAASEQRPAGNAQQGMQPDPASDQGQTDMRSSSSSTLDQASTSEDDAERRSREREAWTKSDQYARLSAEMKRMAGMNKLESGVRTDVGTFLSAMWRPLCHLRVRAWTLLALQCLLSCKHWSSPKPEIPC